MKLPKGVLRVIQGASGVALVAAMSAGCASTVTMAQKPTLTMQATVVASSSENTNETAQTDVEPEPEPDEWSEDDMMAACGRG